jgi:selenide,water dikinase
MPREIVLVGGGHAHIEVLRRHAESPIPDARLTVVDPNPRPVYSGMVPGFVAGQYTESELEIDIEARCERGGARFVETPATRVDAGQRRIELGNGDVLPYDLASLDIGSTVAGRDLPGVAEFALASRPIAKLIAEVGRLFEGGWKAGETPRLLHVVGAGAGGVELAFCLESRLRREASGAFEVALVTGDRAVLAGASAGVRGCVERVLARRGIRTHTSAHVTAVGRGAIELQDGRTLESSGVVWVTGAAAHPLAAASSLPRDEGGFVRVRPSLQVAEYDDLFAVGDCASLPGMKKAGVYAVRTGPLLDHNLRSALAGEGLRDYEPQGDFLSLLNLGDGRAIGAKWGVALEGRSL